MDMLRYRISSSLDPGAHTLYQMFMSAWLTDVCSDPYTFETKDNRTYSIIFESGYDALVVHLKDLPPDLKKYAIIV